MGFYRIMLKLKLKLCLRKFHFKDLLLTLVFIITLFVFLKLHFDPTFGLTPAVHNAKFDQWLKYFSYKTFFGIGLSGHRTCQLLSLKPPQSLAKAVRDEGDCQRVQPLPGSCDVSEALFFSQKKASCSHQQQFEFCSLIVAGNEWTVSCSAEAISECGSTFQLGVVDTSTGSIIWQEVGKVDQLAAKLTLDVKNIHNASTPRYFGFCFIRCKLKSKKLGTYGEQLLILPPQILKSRLDNKESQININIIFLDSVSHQHFFRSMKKTVSTLENINTDPGLTGYVFDFQLVQAVRSRTFESLQVLFSGYIDPTAKPFGTQSLPPERLNLEALLGKYKQKGYHTLWIEDLCHLWEWGLPKDLLFLNKSGSDSDTWFRMWKTLEECCVDSVEITLAMCRVLKANHVRDHFHGPDAVCFNRRHQHEYLLDFLLLYQQELDRLDQPYFTFTMTNVGHEDTGRRIQTLDEALASYIQKSVGLKNTLTILVSDHGNSYGDYFKETQEAQLELFHPIMFIILPNKVSQLIGKEALLNLHINTGRLVSLLDLHYMLKHLIDPTSPVLESQTEYLVSRRGLLDVILFNRTCNHIPRIMPNLCICKNFDMPVEADSTYSLLAYFAIGQLNNELQQQFLSHPYSNLDVNTKPSVVHKCQVLVLVDVLDVKKSYSERGTEVVKMHLQVQNDQIFFVALTITHEMDQRVHAVLTKYDRTTPYSHFSICADPGVDLPLCICGQPSSDYSGELLRNESLNWMDVTESNLLPDLQMETQPLSGCGNCLSLLTIRHDHGAVLFVVSICPNKSFSLDLEIEEQQILFTPPSDLVVPPRGVINVGLIYSTVSQHWLFSVKFRCSLMPGQSYTISIN